MPCRSDLRPPGRGLVDGDWTDTVHPDTRFLFARLGLCLLATAAVAWQARRINVRLGL